MTETFIKKAAKKHNYKYDYSKVLYTKNSVKVIIGCPKHGDFLQTPNTHLSGSGCQKCKIEKLNSDRKKSVDVFITQSKNKHGPLYDYSLVSYKNGHVKVAIICPTHGVFYQRPRSHISGQGCPKCSFDKNSSLLTSNKEEFCLKASAKHNNFYSYELVDYVNSWTNVTITCPKHGNFTQIPNSHLSGKGCPECKKSKLRSYRLSDTATFINKSVKLHGDKYDYSKTVYNSAKEKVSILCKKHGEFKQTPNSHLSGQGCFRCRESIGEALIDTILKKNGISFLREYKIHGNRFEYDFYLPDYNTIIEFNGIQHYQPVEYFGGEAAFKQNVIRDNLKRTLANLYKIRYIVVKYSVLQKFTPEKFEHTLLKSILRK